MQASECQFKLSGLNCVVVRILGESGYGGEGRGLADAAGYESKRAALRTRRVAMVGQWWSEFLVNPAAEVRSVPC